MLEPKSKGLKIGRSGLTPSPNPKAPPPPTSKPPNTFYNFKTRSRGSFKKERTKQDW
jgi:hypothetical protein